MVRTSVTDKVTDSTLIRRLTSSLCIIFPVYRMLTSCLPEKQHKSFLLFTVYIE